MPLPDPTPPGFVCLGVVLCYLLLYVTVRLAVAHGVRDARRRP